MVSPYGEFSLDLPAGRTLNGQEKVVVGYVNDYGLSIVNRSNISSR